MCKSSPRGPVFTTSPHLWKLQISQSHIGPNPQRGFIRRFVPPIGMDTSELSCRPQLVQAGRESIHFPVKGSALTLNMDIQSLQTKSRYKCTIYIYICTAYKKMHGKHGTLSFSSKFLKPNLFKPPWLPVVDGSKVRVAKTQGATPWTETIFASNELIQWAHLLRCDYW